MTVSAKTVYRENGETKQILNNLHTVFCHMFGDLWSLDLSQPNSPEANQQLKTYFRRKKGILSPPPHPNYTPSQRATHTIRNQRNPQRGRR
jgi:hypothetical protein